MSLILKFKFNIVNFKFDYLTLLINILTILIILINFYFKSGFSKCEFVT